VFPGPIARLEAEPIVIKLPRLGDLEELMIEAELAKARALDNPCDLVGVWLTEPRVLWVGFLMQGELMCSALHPLRDYSGVADVGAVWEMLTRLALARVEGASAEVAGDLFARVRLQTSATRGAVP
jgi:hypothetical protein